MPEHSCPHLPRIPAIGSPPRRRGGRVRAAATSTASTVGPPLRTRGTRGGCPDPARSHGIIPAHAGALLWFLGGSRVEGIVPADAGSTDTDTPSPRSGIIPADAGSTTSTHPVSGMTGDHPRGRGEHHIATLRQLTAEGVNDADAGSTGNGIHLSTPYGIIPADAGSTCRGLSARCRRRDHPRGRGEHRRTPCATTRAPGSSPRTGGARPGLVP